jgi:small subunit ribosomal protein S4e
LPSLRNRLNLALNAREVTLVTMDKEAGFKIDNKIRRDSKFPVGVMDVLTVVKTNENYRMLYDVKGRFTLVPIKDAEAKFKLCKVKTKAVGPNKIPYIVTHDARTIRFPHPEINEGDTIKYDLEKNQVVTWYKNESGKLVYITGGNNIGRVGVLTHIEHHQGSFDIAHIRDANGKTFSTRKGNVFIIGDKKPQITLPERDGLYLNILEEKHEREEKRKGSK